MDARSLAQEFEEIVAEIFRLNDFDVQREPKITERNALFQPDLLVQSSIISAVVEIKLWRSRPVPTKILLSAAISLKRFMEVTQRDFGFLVVSSDVSEKQREILRSIHPEIRIFDLSVIALLVLQDSNLAERFERFARDAFAFSSHAGPQRTPDRSEFMDFLGVAIAPDSRPPGRGAELCRNLRSAPVGKTGWRDFENACTEALKYTLGDDLAGWRTQTKSVNGINIYDLVCRINPKHDLWQMIVNQFNSRYLIVEFKNYKDKIKQGQIFTTEKYLHRNALRSTAIIVSREGPDDNAELACRGALRESGRLIINLNIDQLCDMLHAKDDDDDPNSVILDIVDEMLMTIER